MSRHAAMELTGEGRFTEAARPVLHVGYKRTGTTYLQTCVFPLIAPAREMDVHPTGARIAETMPWKNFDTAFFTGETFIYSDEGMVSTVDADLAERIPAISRSLPGVRVVITIRSQPKLFRAFYFLYVKGGGTQSFREFVETRAGSLFQFNRMVSEFRSALGAERVLVILHEDLVAQPKQTIVALLKFAGCEPHLADAVTSQQVKPSSLGLTLRAMRLRNRLLTPLAGLLGERRIEKLLTAGLPGAGLLDALTRATGIGQIDLDGIMPLMKETFARDNAALFRSLGKDITAYDYPRPDSVAATS